ncbi:MAG: DUF2069 domain-containing protein [Pseudomonadota bacterium]
MDSPKYFHLGAIASLVTLILWLVSWEWFIAPLHPGGSWLVLKAVPLLIPLGGVIKRDIYTLQWTSMVILLYFTEGVVRAWSDKAGMSQIMAFGEIAMVCIYFACALLYLRPYKKAAKRIARELMEKVASTKSTK